MLEEERSVARFTESEIEFLLQNRLARLATSSRRGQPHVVPVTFEFDGESFYFGGWNLEKSLKFRNILQNRRVSLVVDDLASVAPWRPRGVEVRGDAEVAESDGSLYVKVVPLRKASWGL